LKPFDVFASLLVIVFFAGYLNIHASLIGLQGGEDVRWVVFAVLGLDLYLKYRNVRNPKEFVRKYWLDIVLLALLPLFAGFKVAKIAVKAIKGAKLSKSGLKAFLGARKLQRGPVKK
jgi:hypothetical protein